MFVSLVVALASTPIALGCAGDDGDDSSDDGADGTGGTSNTTNSSADGGTAPGQGQTDCTPPGAPDPVLCQAGQYCVDPTFADCDTGCISNDNCASGQTCEIPSGESVGTCQGAGPAGPTEMEFCDKLLTCDPAGTMEQCAMVYAGTNETCHQCIVDGNCGDINDGSCDMACGIG